MGSIRCMVSKGTLFMDFRYGGQRLREYTTLPDNPPNRKRLQKALDRIESEIAVGTFDYAKTFGKPLSTAQAVENADETDADPIAQHATNSSGPTFGDFAKTWFDESEITWHRSYRITQRGALDRPLAVKLSGFCKFRGRVKRVLPMLRTRNDSLGIE